MLLIYADSSSESVCFFDVAMNVDVVVTPLLHSFSFYSPVTSTIFAISVNSATAFTISCGGKLIRFRLPLTPPAVRSKHGPFVIPFEESFSGHVVSGDGGSRALIAPGGQFVVTYAGDGSVTLREGRLQDW